MTNRRTGANNECYTDDNHNCKAKEKETYKEEEKEHISKGFKGEMLKVRQTSMSKHIETRNKIKEIADISSFESLLNATILSAEEKSLLKLYYIDNKPLNYIGDMFGYSYSTIKKKHKKILSKISKVL